MQEAVARAEEVETVEVAVEEVVMAASEVEALVGTRVVGATAEVAMGEAETARVPEVVEATVEAETVGR